MAAGRGRALCLAARAARPARHGGSAAGETPRAAVTGAVPTARPPPGGGGAAAVVARGPAVRGSAGRLARDPEAEAGLGGGWMGRSGGGGGRRWGSSRAR